MAMSDDGFLRPASGLSTGRAEAVCPGVALSHESSGGCYDPLWGPIVRTATGFALDSELRFTGSSGGVLSAISLGLIESGMVAFVWQTRADLDDPIGNVTGASRTRAEILEAAGSRYGPSCPLANLGDALATGEVFAFVGKPCDVAALHKLAVIDPRIDRQIPYRLSFFCAGVPSRHGTEALIRALDTRIEDVKSFRYRGEGWPGVARVMRHDGTTGTMDYNSSWGAILNRRLQFRCKICPDGTGEFADIACADAWYGRDGYPDFEEREGRSLIVTRTDAGDKLLKKLIEGGYLSVSPLPVAEIEAMQPYQANRKRNVPARRAALLLCGRLVPRFAGFGFKTLALRHSWIDQARNFMGTLRRLLREGRTR
ncbi:Coenzyme F420 hydrogenase/dehydrogenase, beta subunit C-terminal domain [Rhodoblastus acidophilus]|nr:Coenzyme F420 hydrogenase/dehydrogenase, beta subunit C-terminal domain [Rhodoblastus acidophilus]